MKKKPRKDNLLDSAIRKALIQSNAYNAAVSEPVQSIFDLQIQVAESNLRSHLMVEAIRDIVQAWGRK